MLILFTVAVAFEIVQVWASAQQLEISRVMEISKNMGPTELSALRNTAVNITEVIVNPVALYKQYGMVSPPVIGTTAKAFFNYGVQIVLLLGRDAFGGTALLKRRLDEDVHFAIPSICFQVVGQGSAVFSYWKIAEATMPWKGAEYREAFYFLASQHSSSVVIVVGLAQNLILPRFVKTDTEMYIAQALSVSGLVAGIPLWASIAFAGFPYSLLPLLLASCLISCMVGNLSPGKSHKEMDTFMAIIFGASILNFVGFALGVWTYPGYAFMTMASFVVELVIPVLALLYWISQNLSDHGVGYATGVAFANGLVVVYLVSMSVPVVLLTTHGHLTDATPLAFWGKKILPYFTYTFMRPVNNEIANGDDAANQYSRVVGLWMSELLGWVA